MACKQCNDSLPHLDDCPDCGTKVTQRIEIHWDAVDETEADLGDSGGNSSESESTERLQRSPRFAFTPELDCSVGMVDSSEEGKISPMASPRRPRYSQPLQLSYLDESNEGPPSPASPYNGPRGAAQSERPD
jgi:hypothetical protein